MTINRWTTRKIEVPDGTRIEVWDKIPGNRGWSQKIGKVHYHDGVLHMNRRDVDHIEIHRGPPVALPNRESIQVWRQV